MQALAFSTQFNVAGTTYFTSDSIAHVYNAITHPIDTIFELRHSNIVAFINIVMTTGWVLLIMVAKLTGADLLGDTSSAFLFYYWTATTHLMLLCMVYTSCIEQAGTRVHIQHDSHGTPVRVREDNDNVAHAYPGIAVINPGARLRTTRTGARLRTTTSRRNRRCT
eukprot:19134-Rhodomonas_salina.2